MAFTTQQVYALNDEAIRLNNKLAELCAEANSNPRLLPGDQLPELSQADLRSITVTLLRLMQRCSETALLMHSYEKTLMVEEIILQKK